MAKNKVFIFVPESPVKKALEKTVGLLWKPEAVTVGSDLNELATGDYGLVIDASPLLRKEKTLPGIDYLENVPTALADVSRKIADFYNKK